MKKRVIVGMSGGVDSSVCVHLLKEMGYEVTGVTLELWRDEPDTCEDALEARQNADEMGIEHHVIHGKPTFEEVVVSYFISEYKNGRTPNPCVRCNPTIKWKLLLEAADELGAEYVATGHYAKVSLLDNGRYGVLRATDDKKDQSYVLAQLSQKQLERTVLPLGDYTKDEIRDIAKRLGLTSAEKKDSQDICFIDDNDYGRFLRERLGVEIPGEGDFVLTDGTVVGRHKGITNYTVGQRKGLGIALGERTFVNRIDVEKNQVVLGTDLYVDSLDADEVNFIGEESFDTEREYTARVRYSHHGAPCHVEMTSEGKMRIAFVEPVRGVAPGQTVAVYDGDLLIAGGTIL
ncbi:MAG: tRNA 2-thiouridine(34) synthase MnmA [Lachnospiraceae bacterium]|nr:tRNA 2-thiouridine(34) synthase MnmA [Lachnospiraceae bacterium]